MSSSDELRKLMVINKGKNITNVKSKKFYFRYSYLGGLWVYSITLIVWHAEDIFTQPVIEHFFFMKSSD